MVIVNIIGGLGNQMFQYAVARALSIKLNSTFLLDISGFSNYTSHQNFELQKLFNFSSRVASTYDVNRVLGWQGSPIIRRLVSNPCLGVIRYKSFVIEPHFNYWDGLKLLTDNIYLDGYWQTEKYFSEVAHQIKSDFVFKLPCSKKNTDIAQKINQVNSVSLHVRRGDYINNAKNISIYSQCSTDYYKAAMQNIACQVDFPHFFVFSDDIAWVKNNLDIDYPHLFIDHNHGAESYNDMRLMSLCKHNIIANSTFSWWGAWLNSNKEKIVVAPKQWFANDTNTQDLIPQNWLRL